MAKKTRNGKIETTDYRHKGEKRTNIPPAKIAAEGKVPKVAKVRYRFSPHLPPELRFDPDGKADKLPELIAEAGRRALTEKEQGQLADAVRQHQPWLEWAGKQEQHERGFFEVDPVALHIHERISTQAMLRVLAREDVQRDLFADPQQPYSEAVQFYKHPVDWANRMILGDSLQVMTSLARREILAGKVQMIYMDPPYGIKFSSNFQPQMGQRDVKDRDQDLTREPEMVRAYRDTWLLGVHSYLSYLRDRLTAAREMLSETGSLFVQINDRHVGLIRSLLDEVFAQENWVAQIPFKKTGGFESEELAGICDYVLWYAKDRTTVSYYPLFDQKVLGEGSGDRYSSVLFADGQVRPLGQTLSSGEEQRLPEGARPFLGAPLTSSGASSVPVALQLHGRLLFTKPNQHWKTNPEGMTRLVAAERLFPTKEFVNYRLMLDDFSAVPINNMWTDTMGTADQDNLYVVPSPPKVIERCMLMTTRPGDLILDPTCGGGTSAAVAEQWGRRWITCDTSRVALSLARQRLMTARFPYYQLRLLTAEDARRNPDGAWLSDPTSAVKGKSTFKCKTVPHITLKSIARNAALDPIFAKHEPILAGRLDELNAALEEVTPDLRQKLQTKLLEKQKREGKKSVTDADRRRWILPPAHRDKSVNWTVDAKFAGWYEWEVPFDTDADWPKALQEGLMAYRAAWHAKMDDVNACIAANADMEELADRPEVVNAVVRVTGPFTVEGVRPEELSLGEEGLFDPTPNEFEEGDADIKTDDNLSAYLSKMVQHLRADGLTFLGNKQKKFARVEALFEEASGSLIHAEGSWEGDSGEKANTVAVSFGPQHGPVTALQVEEAIREARRYDELVLAGFSFDAEAYTVVAEQSHPKLRVHIAQIRPDLNEAMDGLLKDTPRSQLFTVFGQPEIGLDETKDGWVCTLKGVDIYDPVENTIRSAGAEKVAAWFLDSDFDGRCFCITQAFFPDQNAWEKIAKALGSSADVDAFEKLKGTSSLPFPEGKYGRIAVKVIDPRGNEVMAIRKLGQA